jgi:chromosomal replication initiator protein
MSEIGGKTASSVVTNLQLKDTALEPTPEIMTTWKRVHNGMRTEFGEAIFRSWLKPLTLQAYYHGTMEISVRRVFMRDWIQTHYAERILEMCGTADAEIKRIQFVVSQAAGPDSVFDSSSEQAVINTVKANENRKNQIAEIASPLDARFKFDTFVVGKSNALAHAAARRVVESMSVPFNPLFIYGGVGLGKTHLMHAIAHALEQHWPDKVVMYLSAEKFMYQFVKALRANDTMAFQGPVPLGRCSDDRRHPVHNAGKESTQEEFFHTFNALVDQNKQIIISADKAPSDLTGIDERLAFAPRMGSGGRYPADNL